MQEDDRDAIIRTAEVGVHLQAGGFHHAGGNSFQGSRCVHRVSFLTQSANLLVQALVLAFQAGWSGCARVSQVDGQGIPFHTVHTDELS